VNPATPDTFLRACGAAGPLTALVIGPGENDRRSVLLERGFVLVGRHPRACVRLEDARVCLRHLYLQILGGQLYGFDLGSGTVFRGHGRFSSGWAAPGSFFRLGPYHVSVRFSTGPNANPLAADPLAHRCADSAFVPLAADVLVGNVRQTRWRMTRRLVLVGRDPSVRLRLRDRSVSRFHAALVGTPQGVWVVDLLSREGTWVNGSRTPCARLMSGDRVRFGCYDLDVQTGEPLVRLAQPVTDAPKALPAPEASKALILPGAAGPAAPAGLPALPPEASVLLPILQQFGLFQQQMLDQFQQSLMMMLQTFAKMSSDQMELIREELAELRQLTEDLREAKRQQDAAPVAAPTPHTPAATGVGLLPPVEVNAAPAPPVMTPPGPAPADADVHDWLSRRIADIENRREGVLKRVMRKITGG
jgi:hypothetical protein